jgi:transcriptional regulator with XRE-family HTH domain
LTRDAVKPIFELGSRARSNAMGTKFSDFMKELEEETRREGPAAVAEAAVMQAQFKLAAELILLRRERGLTQRQLSARTGIQQSEISRIEGGRANPTVSTIAILVEALEGEFSLRRRRRAKSSGSTRSAASGRRAPHVIAARITAARPGANARGRSR